MKKSSLHTAWAAGVALTLTLVVSIPAYADDVELLISNQATSNETKPNIMFILDSSGSMTSLEKVLTESITFDDTVFFVSFSPDSSGQANCSAGRGTNFLYRVSVINGDPVGSMTTTSS